MRTGVNHASSQTNPAHAAAKTRLVARRRVWDALQSALGVGAGQLIAARRGSCEPPAPRHTAVAGLAHVRGSEAEPRREAAAIPAYDS